jgi:hypothetical protein
MESSRPRSTVSTFALSDLPDGPLVLILSSLPMADQELLNTVSKRWALCGARADLWYGLAVTKGIKNMPRPSARSSRSKADLRRAYFAMAKAHAIAQRQLLDKLADSLVKMMQRFDSVSQLRKELLKAPALASHEMDPAARNGHATLLHAASRYGRVNCARLLLAQPEHGGSGGIGSSSSGGIGSSSSGGIGSSSGGGGSSNGGSGSSSGGSSSASCSICPSGHPLCFASPAPTPAPTSPVLTCDVCSGSIEPASPRCTCVECNYDVCHSCDTSSIGGSSGSPLLFRKDMGGFTPLLTAAWCGHLGLTELLLAAGSPTDDVGVPPLTSSCGGKGPFDAKTWAMRKGFLAVSHAILMAQIKRRAAKRAKWEQERAADEVRHVEMLEVSENLKQRVAALEAEWKSGAT